MTSGLPRTAIISALAASLVMLVAAAPAAAKVEYGLAPQTSLGVGDYQKMASIKTDVLKTGIAWGTVQASSGDCTAAGGACDWSGPDATIGAAAAHGSIRSVVGLIGSASFVNGNPLVPPVNDLNGWKDFVGAAVERYGPGGAYWSGPYQAQFGGGAPVVPVKDFQVWNEQSSFQFFKPKPNVKKYAKILVAASDAINDANKQVKILLGGMFPDTGRKGINLEPYLKDLYKAKGVNSKTFDAVSIHPYAKDKKQLTQQIGGARKVMDKSGGRKDDIWITEIGYGSNGPKSQPVVKNGEKGQADAIKDAYKTLNKKDKSWGIVGIIYFTWQDVNGGGVCRFCQFAGLLDPNGGEKKAFKVYSKVAK